MLKRLFGKDIDVTPTDYISRKVKRIRKKFAGLNLDDVCKALNIRLRYEPLGNSDEACKGYYCSVENSNDSYKRRIAGYAKTLHTSA